MAAFPAALAVSIVGIVRDETKWLAILVAIGAGLIFFVFCLQPLVRLVC